jgi:hypothetical protein
MIFRRLRALAQTIGFATFALLMVYGAISLFYYAKSAYGSPLMQAGVSGTVPPYLNYQGILRDPEGNLMSGLHDMTFRIYDRVSAPQAEAVWSEIHEDVTVRDGQFSVLLGNTTPLPFTIFYGPDTFIGVTVAPFDEMVPRQRFASVPFAIYADHASSLTSPNATSDTAVSVTADGRVGIGTENPGYLLDVDGRMRVREGDDLTSGGIWFADGSGATDYGFVGMDTPARIGFWGNAGAKWGLVMDTTDGDVGLGTQAPSVPLHVLAPDPDLTLDAETTTGETSIRFSEAGQSRAAIEFIRDTDALQLASQNQTSLALAGDLVTLDTLNATGSATVGGNLHAEGNLRLGSQLKPPVLIKRFTGLTNDIDVEIKFDGDFVLQSEYDCVATSWSVRMDVDEDDAGPYMVWTYATGGGASDFWRLRARFWTDSDESSAVDVLCFLKGVVSDYEGSRTHSSFP